MLSENARDIEGYEGVYSITDDGRVYSHSRIVQRKGDSTSLMKGRWLKPGINSRGYLTCALSSEGMPPKSKTVHRLVADAFVKNENNMPCVNHIDGNKLNNNACNLEWVSHGENQSHAYKLNLRRSMTGELNSNSKLTADDIHKIKELDKDGLKRSEIAKLFGVDKSLITSIMKGKAWGHINGS